MTPVLELQNVSVAYGGIPAVTGVSLRVAAGSIVTVIGPNGAGKSTLLNAVMGVLPAQGSIRFNGRDLRDALGGGGSAAAALGAKFGHLDRGASELSAV